MKSLRHQLLEASQSHRLDWLEDILSQGVDVNTLIQGESALCMAIRFHQFETAKFLLVHGADPNLVTKPDGLTAIHVAAMQSVESDMIKSLVDSGANIHQKCGKGLTALERALSFIKASTFNVKQLLKHGADANGRTPSGGTFLQFAALHKKWESMMALIRFGADPKLPEYEDSPLIFKIITNIDADALQKLLQLGLPSSGCKHYGETVLGHLIQQKPQDIEKLKVLISSGININELNQYGRSPLDIAKRYSTEMAKILKKEGAKTNAPFPLNKKKPPKPKTPTQTVKPLAPKEPALPPPQLIMVTGPINCNCKSWPREKVIGDLSQSACLRQVDLGRKPSWHQFLQCKNSGLILEAAGYDVYGKDCWEFRLTGESFPLFLELIDEGKIQASDAFLNKERKRLNNN